MPTLDPYVRSIQNRRAALIRASRYDRIELTAAATAAFEAKFYRQVDPEGMLDPRERHRRALAARRAHFQAMAARSVAARRAKKGWLDPAKSSTTTPNRAAHGDAGRANP